MGEYYCTSFKCTGKQCVNKGIKKDRSLIKDSVCVDCGSIATYRINRKNYTATPTKHKEKLDERLSGRTK